MVTRRWTLGVAGGLCVATIASVAAVAIWSGWSEERAVAAASPLSSERAGVAARLAGAAVAGSGDVWRSRFREELGRAYAPAPLRTFVRSAPDRCAGGAATTGAFYCAEARALAIDLATLDELKARMRGDGEVSVALFAGRAAVTQPQAELGLGGSARERAEAGDCLAGVWVAQVGLRGATPDVYARMLVAVDDAARAAAPGRSAARDPALFAPGAEGVRKDAYARGLASGTIAGCVAAR